MIIQGCLSYRSPVCGTTCIPVGHFDWYERRTDDPHTDRNGRYVRQPVCETRNFGFPIEAGRYVRCHCILALTLVELRSTQKVIWLVKLTPRCLIHIYVIGNSMISMVMLTYPLLYFIGYFNLAFLAVREMCTFNIYLLHYKLPFFSCLLV